VIEENRKFGVNFLYNRAQETAKCNLCSVILKAGGSSTKSLINHLKSKHRIHVRRCYEAVSEDTKPKSKVVRIEAYFRNEKESLSEVTARLVSVDGLTFNQIANSSLIRRAFKDDGYFLPTSPQNIRDHLIKEFEKTLRIVSEKVDTITKNGCHFSISFDEAASVRNRRYMNLYLHHEQSIQPLGMIRVKGSMKTEKAIELVRERLSKFNLNLDTDIVSTIAGGANVMMKFGRDTRPLRIACLAHAIHLCVCDVLYREAKE